MQIKKINENFYVSPQIFADDLESIKSHGIKTIICNRPDDEDAEQPRVQSLIDAGVAHELKIIFIPAESGNVSVQQIGDFSDALNENKGPVLAYCRTGTRSSILWTLSQAGKSEFKDVLQQTQKVGYELSHLKKRFDDLS